MNADRDILRITGGASHPEMRIDRLALWLMRVLILISFFLTG